MLYKKYRVYLFLIIIFKLISENLLETLYKFKSLLLKLKILKILN